MTTGRRPAAIARVQAELTTIARRGSARVRREDAGLSVVDRSLLAYLEANPGRRAVDIAAHFQLNRSTVSRQLAALDEAGLVEAAAPGAGGARGQGLRLTSSGERALHASDDTLRETMTARLSGWSPDEIEAFAGMLERYNAADASEPG